MIDSSDISAHSSPSSPSSQHPSFYCGSGQRLPCCWSGRNTLCRHGHQVNLLPSPTHSTINPTEVSRPATSCVFWTHTSETSRSLGGDHCSTTLEYRSLKLCTWWRITREPTDATIICIWTLKWIVQDIEGVEKISTTPEFNCFFFFFFPNSRKVFSLQYGACWLGWKVSFPPTGTTRKEGSNCISKCSEVRSQKENWIEPHLCCFHFLSFQGTF